MTVLWYNLLDSTNAEVLRRCGELDNLSVVAARSQTAGRGQRGNTWSAAAGENLTFSILLRLPPDLPTKQVIAINALAALSVRDYLRSRGVPALIKWPNDIYVGKRKICGILVENRMSPDAFISVIGIGINVNQTLFPASLPNPTSLSRETGAVYDTDKELEGFLHVFSTLYPSWQEDPEGLCGRYAENLFQAGIPCPYRDLRSGEVFTGIIRGVDGNGLLSVERKTAGGVPAVSQYGFKEIGYIL